MREEHQVSNQSMITAIPATPRSIPVQAARTVSLDKTRQPDFFVACAFLGDTIMIILGLWLGYWLKFSSGWITLGIVDSAIRFSDYVGLIAIGASFLLGMFSFMRLYDPRNLLRFRRNATIIFKATIFWLCVYLGVSLVLKFSPPISRIYAFCSFFCALTAVLTWRWLFHYVLRLERFAKLLRQRVLFVGWNQDAHRFTEAVQNDIGRPFEVMGCVPLSDGTFQMPPVHDLVFKSEKFEDLHSIVENHVVDIVILTDVEVGREQVMALANACEKAMVQFKIIPSYFQILLSGLRLDTISGIPIMGVSDLPLDRLSNRILKRTVDIMGATVGLIFAMPLVLICGLLILRESPGPILFIQERIGRYGRKFNMLKLRSMHLGAEAHDNLNQSTQRSDPRMLKIGRFMRCWNIDEIPQFWNVLQGDMSLVGPRPERTYHSERLSQTIPHYNARYASKPGMTGWAQVNGFRGDTDLAERIRFDLFYLENWSLWLDFQIMIQTFIKRDNAY